MEDSIKIPPRNSLLGYFMSGNRTEETKVCRNVKLDFLQVDKALQVEGLNFFHEASSHLSAAAPVQGGLNGGGSVSSALG